LRNEPNVPIWQDEKQFSATQVPEDYELVLKAA
jgi:hypothetical protein